MRTGLLAHWRASENILGAYFLYTSILALLLEIPLSVRLLTLAVNAAVLAVLAGLLYARKARHAHFFSFVRDWLPLPLALLAYKQMGWFAPPSHSFELENSWVQWDRLVLEQWGVRHAIDALHPILPAVLEISYSLVYTLPVFCLISFYLLKQRARVDALLSFYLLGLFLAYAQYPLWPSEPPWTVFPGEMYPERVTIFRRFNQALLGHYGIHTSVFPSAHVSGAFAAAFALWRLAPERRRLNRCVTLYACLVFWATVYGRYHYLADAVAGLAIAALAVPVGHWILRNRQVTELTDAPSTEVAAGST
jgi:membrane-associated phospholipid phosphatase